MKPFIHRDSITKLPGFQLSSYKVIWLPFSSSQLHGKDVRDNVSHLSLESPPLLTAIVLRILFISNSYFLSANGHRLFLSNSVLHVDNNICNKQNQYYISMACYSIRIIYSRLIIEITQSKKKKPYSFPLSGVVFTCLACLLSCFMTTQNP